MTCTVSGRPDSRLAHPAAAAGLARRRRCAPLLLSVLLATAPLAGCVTENLDTGEMVPRGNQRYQFSTVEKYAERLKNGMSKMEVLLLMGSAAEMDDKGDVWIYLPERYAILVPARALRLEFKDDLLVDHGYRPIVLGATL